ncbi:MAG: AMP-binding protein, partial [Spirochaetota bacterium]
SADKYDEMLSAVDAKAVFVAKAFADIQTSVRKIPAELGMPSADARVKIPDVTLEDTATYLFTSGTTGSPKIVTLSHRNVLHICLTCTELEEYTEKDYTLAILPLFHVYALESTFLAPFVTGSTIVVQPSLKGPDILKSLADYPITIFPAAPQMWTLFFDAITGKVKAKSKFAYRFFMFMIKAAPFFRAAGLSVLPNKVFAPIHAMFGKSHRFFISGGAPLKKEYFNAYKSMGFDIMEGYGLTETTGPIAIPYYTKSEAGSVGAPIKGNEVKIKNPGYDKIGEVWLRGEAVMKGYFRNDAANKEAFDSEGFFNSGDLGRVDKKGYIFLTGRFKNVIILESGKNVYPEELELYYSSSDEIEEIAVIGRMIRGSETVCAVIVPKVKSPESYDKIGAEIQRLSKGLPSYKTIHEFALAFDPLPKNSTRKVLIPEVKKLWEEGRLFGKTAASASALQIITPHSQRDQMAYSLISQYIGNKTLHPGNTLIECGIDSLHMIELIVK